jgi:hypothetical protein
MPCRRLYGCHKFEQQTQHYHIKLQSYFPFPSHSVNNTKKLLPSTLLLAYHIFIRGSALAPLSFAALFVEIRSYTSILKICIATAALTEKIMQFSSSPTKSKRDSRRKFSYYTSILYFIFFSSVYFPSFVAPSVLLCTNFN